MGHNTSKSVQEATTEIINESTTLKFQMKSSDPDTRSATPHYTYYELFSFLNRIEIIFLTGSYSVLCVGITFSFNSSRTKIGTENLSPSK